MSSLFTCIRVGRDLIYAATAYEPAVQLPIGLQLLGKALEEARIFQIAHAYEQSTDWHKARRKSENAQPAYALGFRLRLLRRDKPAWQALTCLAVAPLCGAEEDRPTLNVQHQTPNQSEIGNPQSAIRN